MTSFRILSFFACFLRYFPDNDFGTLAFLFVQSCLCVTFTSWSTPSFEMLLSKLSNRNTHVCTSSIRMISFFTLQCELFIPAIIPALCPHEQEERGWSTKCGQTCTVRGGSQKFPHLCGHPLCSTSSFNSFCNWTNEIWNNR